jgi:hypothetical protein
MLNECKIVQQIMSPHIIWSLATGMYSLGEKIIVNWTQNNLANYGLFNYLKFIKLDIVWRQSC